MNNKQLLDNITILQRKLVGLKDTIGKKTLSPGQIRFISVYLNIISEYIDKNLDLLDENKYKEILKEIFED